jgi:hypothetical protein
MDNPRPEEKRLTRPRRIGFWLPYWFGAYLFPGYVNVIYLAEVYPVHTDLWHATPVDYVVLFFAFPVMGLSQYLWLGIEQAGLPGGGYLAAPFFCVALYTIHAIFTCRLRGWWSFAAMSTLVAALGLSWIGMWEMPVSASWRENGYSYLVPGEGQRERPVYFHW